MAFLSGLVTACVLLLITPGWMFYFDVTPKNAALLLGAGAGLLLLPRAWPDKGPHRWLWILLGAQAASLLLSYALSTARDLSLHGANWRRFGIITQLALLVFTALSAAWLAQGRDRVITLLRVLTLSGLAAALYGIAQYFGIDPLQDPSSYRVGEGIWMIVRTPGTLGRANYFASALLFVTFCGTALWRLDPVRALRACGMAAMLLAPLAIVLSGTRAAIAGLLLGAVVAWIWMRPRFRWRPIAIAAAALAAFAVLYFSPAGEQLRARAKWNADDPFGGARIWLWRDALRMASHRLAAGYGPDAFGSAFPPFQSEQLAHAYPDFFHESPHNLFLDTLTAQGLPGLCILLGLIALAFRTAWRRRLQEPVLCGLLAAALAAGLLSLQFIVPTVPLALLLLLTVAMLLPPQAAAPVKPWLRYEAVIPALLFFAAAIQLTLSDIRLEQANRALEANDFARAFERYDSARQLEPAGASDLWWSRKLLAAVQRATDPVTRLQLSQRGLEAAIRATTSVEDRQNAWYNLAAFYARSGQSQRTEQALRQAIEAAPNWFKPHWTLSRLLSLTGRKEEAAREAERAVALNAGRNPEVAESGH